MAEPICEIDADGNKEWWLNGELHRTDGPAVEDADGTKVWYLNGKQVNGPYDIMSDKDAFWWSLVN